MGVKYLPYNDVFTERVHPIKSQFYKMCNIWIYTDWPRSTSEKNARTFITFFRLSIEMKVCLTLFFIWPPSGMKHFENKLTIPRNRKKLSIPQLTAQCRAMFKSFQFWTPIQTQNCHLLTFFLKKKTITKIFRILFTIYQWIKCE